MPSSASQLAQQAAVVAKAKSRAALKAEAAKLSSSAAAAENERKRKAKERKEKKTKSTRNEGAGAKGGISAKNPTPGSHDLHLNADDRRAFHGQLYAYMNRITRNSELCNDYDVDEIRRAMFALVEAFSADGVADVDIVRCDRQTDLEDRYGAHPILMARVAELEEERKGSGAHPLADSLSEMRDLVREASEAASRAALTASEAIVIAAQAKKKAKTSIVEKQAWEKRLSELRIWADDAKKAGGKAERAVKAWDERHKKKLYYYTRKNNKRQRGKYSKKEEESTDLERAMLVVHPEASATKRPRTSEAVSVQNAVGVGKESNVDGANEDACAETELEAATVDSDLEAHADSEPPTEAKRTTSPAAAAVAEEAEPVAAVAAPPPPQKDFSGLQPQVSWEERFQHLLHWKSGYGHCIVPIAYTADETPGLGRWVAKMRSDYTSWLKMSPEEQRERSERNQYGAGLTEERIARLEAEGFVWRVPRSVPLSWSERLEQLRAFREEFGHVSVPRSHPGNLGEWCKIQRVKKKAGELDSQRLRDLEALNFCWNADKGSGKMPWQERFEMMVDFRRRYGHCNAFAVDCDTEAGNQSAKDGEEEGRVRASPDYAPIVQQLRSWTRMQRGEYRKLIRGKKSRIDKVKIKKLEDIGFEWRIRKLRRYGDFNDES